MSERWLLTKEKILEAAEMPFFVTEEEMKVGRRAAKAQARKIVERLLPQYTDYADQQYIVIDTHSEEWRDFLKEVGLE